MTIGAKKSSPETDRPFTGLCRNHLRSAGKCPLYMGAGSYRGCQKCYFSGFFTKNGVNYRAAILNSNKKKADWKFPISR
jgi:hypothetical protein